MTRYALLVVGAGVLACRPAASPRQAEPLPVAVVVADPPQLGRPIPAFALPYAASDGPGPTDQPFDIRKELGRVVVVAFCRVDVADECLTQWRTFRDQREAIFGAGVVVVGVSSDSVGGLAAFARANDLPFKLLSDPPRSLARRFLLVDRGQVRHTVIVVGRDGRVRHVDGAFDAFASSSYTNLAAAVRAAREI